MAKKGDKIQVHGAIVGCFNDGDIGWLTRFDGEDWWANINCDEWCVGVEDSPNGFSVLQEPLK